MIALSAPLPDGVTLSLASAADNVRILHFMGTHGMDAGMSLRFDRSPDYFALHNAHSPDVETWLLQYDREILGISSFVARKAWIGGRIEHCVYLADLRFVRRRAIAGLWRPLMRDILLDIRARHGARFAYCSILRDNKAARHALLRKRGAAAPFAHLRAYSTVSIIARKPGGMRRDRTISIRRARPADQARLCAFVAEQSRETDFGPVFDDGVWARRLQHWPDFGIDSFYLATDAQDRLLGCLAPWDSSAISRIVIDRLAGSARIARRLCNWLAPLTGRPKIFTGPGTSLPDIALTHVFIDARSPEVFAEILRVAVKEIFATRRYATISLCVYDDDPLQAALNGYWRTSVPMDLYWTDIAALAKGESPAALAAGRFPGFEAYLV